LSKRRKIVLKENGTFVGMPKAHSSDSSAQKTPDKHAPWHRLGKLFASRRTGQREIPLLMKPSYEI